MRPALLQCRAGVGFRRSTSPRAACQLNKKSELGEQVGPPLPGLAKAQPRSRPSISKVFAACQNVVQGGVLANQADAVPDLRSLRDHVEAGHPGTAAIRAEQRGQEPDRRRLACPIRTEQGDHAAPSHLEIKSVEDLDITRSVW